VIEVRRLRFHSFLYLIEPTAERRERIEQDQKLFESALEKARQFSTTPEQRSAVDNIDSDYRIYLQEMGQLLADGAPNASRSELVHLIDAHPVNRVVDPSAELLRVNKEIMVRTSEESVRVSRLAHITMILLGVLGPVGGVLAGYGVARALSRSIYRLGVRVKDVTSRLDQNVASVSIEADGDLRGLDRQLEYVVKRVEEVTERQQQHQREMLRAEQLSAVGQLAASVAHEVRNPLTAVKMLVELALRSENAKSLTTNDLKVIHREVARVEHTVQGLLDFARPPAPQRSRSDLSALVAEAIELVRARARQQRVEISTTLPEVPVTVDLDRGQIGTVLVNLLMNALDAMPQSGRLEVRLDKSPPGGVILTVTDTGAGIAPELAGRLFTPFVSTKPTGTGLGLSISRRIVEEHGGQLTAENRAEGGARFTIKLPGVRYADSASDRR
jgi:signal transduction histidine kinase